MKKLLSTLILLSMLISLFSCTPVNTSVNGVKVDKYSIVYSDEDLDYSKRAAEYIQAKIYERTNVKIKIVEDSEKPATDYEIVVGNTDRAISAKLDEACEGLEFAIMADGNSIALEGDYFIIAAAAYFFVETYVPIGGGDTVVPAEATVHTPITKEAENFILLIGDGMGVYQTQIFDYMENTVDYSDGEDLFYGYLLPYMGTSRTSSLSGVTDSAAGGTALSCGIKTLNEHIGKDENTNDVKSLTELAYELGMKAGVMSTETDTGATPAAFSAHSFDRDDKKDIRLSQAQAKKDFGTLIECGYDYYKANQIVDIESNIETMLSQLSENDSNFFLMYEDAHIDKHCHNNNIEKTLNAIARFNQAIGRFMEYAFYNPGTMVIITADHETGDLYPDENGVLQYHHDDHTGADVKIFAYGEGAELFDGVNIENIQIAHTIAALMGEENFGDQSVYQSLTK